MKLERKSHWENSYTIKAPTDVSWYQPHAEKSLELIARTGLGKGAQIIDAGGGASSLTGDLLARGVKDPYTASPDIDVDFSREE